MAIQKWGIKVKTIAGAGVAAAMATVLSAITVFYRMPNGGEVSLRALPLVLFSLVAGPRAGAAAGIVYGAVNLLTGSRLVHWAQAPLDYVFPFACLGITGLFLSAQERETGKFSFKGVAFGLVAAWMARLAFHTLSGVLFFSEYAPPNMNPWLFSLTYNLTFLGIELVAVGVALALLPIGRLGAYRR